MKKYLLVLSLVCISAVGFAKEKEAQRNPNAARGKSAKSRLQTGTPDVFVGSLKQGADEDCPVLITENSSESCARFGFVDLSLQGPVLQSINETSSVVKMSGRWGTRETGQGKKAPLFIVDYVTTE